MSHDTPRAMDTLGAPPMRSKTSQTCCRLHAGTRKRFKAKVMKLRKQFPRIVVKYIEDETGGAHPLQLPDPSIAYLTMSDVEPGTLIMA